MSGKADVNKSPAPSKKAIGRRRVKSVKAPKAAAETPVVEKPVENESLEQWVELFPHGISISSSLGRPVLILKDKAGAEVLPVWMQPLDAGVAIAELSHSAGATPHMVTRRLLEALNLKLESCTFVELIGHHQFVNLTLRGEDQVTTLRVRADEAMSFCLQGHARFFSTRALMARCRSLDVDLSKLEQNLVHGQLPQLTAEMEISSKKHPYVM